MVDKLEEIHDKKDRMVNAQEEYSEAIREAVRAVRRENPMGTMQKIASMFGVTRQRIEQLLKPSPVRIVKEVDVVELECAYCHMMFERPTKIHLARQKRGNKDTYCGATCQRTGFGESRRLASLRTECQEGHPLTQNNTLILHPKASSGKRYTRRQCKICRNRYARELYHRKKNQPQEDKVNDRVV